MLSATHALVYCCREARPPELSKAGSATVCSAVVPPRGWGAVLDGLTLRNVSFSHLGSKVAAAVRTLDIVWVLHRQDGGQV